MTQRILKDVFTFNGPMIPPVAASVTAGPWASKDTSAAGSPTIQANNGFMELALESTNEIQNLCFYMGDQLPYDIDDLVQVDFWVKLSASLGAAVSAAFGLASRRNDAIASITNRCLFRCVGNNSLLAEVSDGTHTQASIATGLSLSTTVLRCSMSFKEGINTVERGLSTGGKSRILFAADNGRGQLRPVAQNTQFDMSSYGGGLQLFAQLQKTAAVTVGTLSIKRIEVQYRDN